MQERDELKYLRSRVNVLEFELEKIVEERTKELKLSEEKFRLLFDKSRDPILIVDGYNFIECNDATVNLLSYNTKEDLYNVHPSKLSPEYQVDGKLSYEKAQEMMDIAYTSGYHRFEWIHSDKFGNNIFMDVALTKIPYKGKDMLFTVWRNISVQKEFEKNILEREKQYSALFEQAADGILVGIHNGEIVEVNESLCLLTGYKKSELVGKNITFLFEKKELENKPLRFDLVKKGEIVIRERNITRKDGGIVPVEMNTKIIHDGRLQALFRDLTKRKEAEYESEISKKLLEKAEEVAGLGRYYYDFSTDTWLCTEIMDKIYGINEEYNKNIVTWFNLIHPEYREEMINYFNINVLKNRGYFDKVYKIIRKNDFKPRWIHGYGDVEYDEDNNPLKMVGTIQDITERKEAELALKASEEKFKSLATLLPEVIYEADLRGNLTFVNLKAYEIFGYTPEDFKKGINLFQVIGPEDITRAKEQVKKIFANKKSYGQKYIAIKKNGESFPILVYSDIVKRENEIIGLRGIIIDISELERAQEDLRKSEEKFRLLFENSQDAIFILDEKGIVDCNIQTMKMFGYKTKNELLTKTINDLSPDYQPDGVKSNEKIKELLSLAKRGDKQIYEWVHSKPGGGSFFSEVNIIPFKIDGKQYLQSIVRDITDRKEVEQRIFNAVTEAEEKERQRLASDIHDDIGPILSSLKMYIDSLSETNDEKKQRYLKQQLQELIKDSIKNVREVSNALSPYLLRKYGLKVSIKAYIENSKKFMDIAFRSNLNDERFPINIETVYYRVVKELLNNTLKHSEAQKVTINLYYKKDILKLQYTDNGKGLKESELEDMGKKGMGLYNITNRIKSINGYYKFYTEQKCGFKFKVEKEIKKLEI